MGMYMHQIMPVRAQKVTITWFHAPFTDHHSNGRLQVTKRRNKHFKFIDHDNFFLCLMPPTLYDHHYPLCIVFSTNHGFDIGWGGRSDSLDCSNRGMVRVCL